MAIARLTRVDLLTAESELGSLLGLLIEFGKFHPSEREGLVQDTNMLLLGSRAQEVSFEAGEVLRKNAFPPLEEVKPVPVEFKAVNLDELIESMETLVADTEVKLSSTTDEAERRELLNGLRAVREAAKTIFYNLQRIRVFPGLEHAIILEGYVPTETLPDFRGLAGRYLLSDEAVDKREPKDPYVPTLLVNSRLVSLFENLTLEQGVPKYNEIDPTPIVAFVFPFFFGIMFGDVGHGAVLLAFGYFLVRKTKYEYWGRLIEVFGISAVAIGFVRGLVFGVEFEHPLQPLIPLPAALKGGFSLSYVPLLLEAAVIIGTFHLAAAYLIAFLNQVRSRNYSEAFLGHLPTLVLYGGLVPLALALAGNNLQTGNLLTSTKSTPVLEQFLGIYVPVYLTAELAIPFIVAALIVLILGHPLIEFRTSRSVRKTMRALGVGVLEAVTRPFEFFLNTLSYIRLGILFVVCALSAGLVTSAIALGPVGVFLAVVLNLAIIGMEGLIVYVQDLRLHVYEWFSKFYFGLGEPFRPLVSAGVYSRVSWG